ncbi:MAG: hypothetical protein M3Z28_08980 [Candidatus Dormibacteraeota bacterium]|nr:hypothetical protein [Candidatus Dormibacteraeota bacterium]
MSVRPSDACPYPKPFTADFNDCPTYQTRHAIVVDSNDRPLRTIWSCRHLETKQLPGATGHYYGACQLGDAKGRQEWVQRIGAERIRNIQKLRAQIMPLAQAFVDDLACLKGQHGEATRSNGDATQILDLMKERGQRYLEDLEALLNTREELLQLAGMPPVPVMQLARQWVDEFVVETLGRSRSAPVLPDELVASLPESVRVFYAPS